jgi:hypothetical protein
MRERLKRSAYHSEGGSRLFESVRGDVRAGLLFLKEAGFEDYWRRSVLPGVAARAAAFAEGLSRHDVIGEVEGRLGFRLSSDFVDVYVLHFARPHGIRLTGARIVTDGSYPLEVFLRLTVHELLHPPFRLAQDKELKRSLDALRADAFLMEKVARHNPSFGYNSFESFVEEDCVRALEQVISERLGFAADARRRWAEEDGGIHVLAVVLYELMRRDGYCGRREVFGDFLLRSLRAGSLAPGKIKAVHDSFYTPGRP